MPVVQQSVVLPARAEELYATYVDPKRHTAVTGSAVTIGDRPGAPFSAFYGSMTGRILALDPPRLIVQAWRSTNFHLEDADSTLVLEFVPQGTKGRITLIQLDVPKHALRSVAEGWELYYWAPWRRYLKKR